MRLLVVRIGAMGDVLHALPAVSAIRAELPAAHISWAIDPRWLPLLRDRSGHMPLVNSVFPVDTRLWKQRPVSLATLHSVRALRRDLRAGDFDLCLDLQGSIRSALVGRMAGARTFAGPAQPRETPAVLLYGSRIVTREAHVVDQAAELAGAALRLSLAAAPVRLPEDPAAEAWWQLHRPPDRQPFVLLVPQAGWGAKQWPAARFGQLAQHLSRAGFAVLVNCTRAADPLALAVVAAADGTASAMPADLSQLIAITRRASLVVAGDTGPLHLAAALRRPVLALFGPTDPARTGPYGTPSRVLRHPSSVTDHSRHAATEEGLLHISSETVIEAALDLLRSSPAAGPA